MSSTPTQAQQLWEDFRQDPSGNHYLADCHIVFLPTGAGAANEKYVRDFYRTGGFSHPKQLAVEETVIHRTVGESSAVDEVELTVKFVSGNGGWLLPGIAPHHLEDLTITFPLIICASFVENRIASVRYVWDNASVLKMVRLIGSRQSWPIVAETQVDALRNPSRFRLNPYGNPSTTGGARPAQTGISNIFGATPPISPSPSSPNSSATKKGHPALTSTVFSHLKTAPLETENQNNDMHARLPLSPSSSDESLSGNVTSPVSPAKKGHPALTSTLFSHLNKNEKAKETYERGRTLSSGNDDSTTQSESPAPHAKKGHPALTSTVFSHLKEQPQEQPRQQHQTQKKGHPALTSTLFSHLKEQPQEQPKEQQQTQKKGHPALTSTLFNHLKDDSQVSVASSKQHQHQEETHATQHTPSAAEQAAGWRADYVKPKGHPALTSTIFSQKEPTPTPGYTRPYKKTSHNIFGNPDEQKSKAIPVAQSPEGTSFVLQPSTIEDDVEEVKVQDQEQDVQTVQEHEDHVDNVSSSLEKISIQDVPEAAIATPLLEAQEAPLSPPPASVQHQQPARRMHPNYRSQISFG
ncbi:hypothetical protein BGZ93_003390 [Podila epicladia]|nr:hypothetical protein BGZ92_004167 [Podila epicladia]KAG0100220.1 hypothetical protein BGZ93_003390 [Podila epicladia]